MRFFEYTAIITRLEVTSEQASDRRDRYVDVSFTTNTLCVRSYALAKNLKDARKNALKDAQEKYPIEQGYSNHENISVAVMAGQE